MSAPVQARLRENAAQSRDLPNLEVTGTLC
jgi:hypothetical protein